MKYFPPMLWNDAVTNRRIFKVIMVRTDAPDAEAAAAAKLLAEAMGAVDVNSPTRTKEKKEPAPAKPELSIDSMPAIAPEASHMAARVWKSRRAKYSHLPPVTIKLVYDGAEEEVRVDAVARCGDVLRDLASGGPATGIYGRLGLGTSPRKGTPRRGREGSSPCVHVTGLQRRGSALHLREVLEEGEAYELVIERPVAVDLATDAAQQLVAGTAAALGVAEDSSDWSDNEVEPQ